jgi:type II secretory pathway pseudopilin PulG
MARNQKGFTAVEALLIMIIVAMLGGVGWYVWHSQRTANKNLDDASNTVTQPTSVTKTHSKSENCDPTMPSYSFIKYQYIYYSKYGCYSIKLPSDWNFYEYKNDPSYETYDLKNFSGAEHSVWFNSKTSTDQSSKVNNFGGSLDVFDQYPYDTNDFKFGNVIKHLSNSLDVWVNQKKLIGTSQENNCPTIHIASDDHLGYQLASGRWMEFSGSYCWAQGTTTNSKSYDQALSSKEYKQAINMLNSITWH